MKKKFDKLNYKICEAIPLHKNTGMYHDVLVYDETYECKHCKRFKECQIGCRFQDELNLAFGPIGEGYLIDGVAGQTKDGVRSSAFFVTSAAKRDSVIDTIYNKWQEFRDPNAR